MLGTLVASILSSSTLNSFRRLCLIELINCSTRLDDGRGRIERRENKLHHLPLVSEELNTQSLNLPQDNPYHQNQNPPKVQTIHHTS